ncbi:unnamed protein product [Cylicocyclus nassatus]|uniref:SCP domain-containing protein n=1 Tax=Cylicocyclus nassatus TaxID=53992 RepID=A0AA36GZ58_CYLNA|nr:unnamed protein product [Cylicocyclus nassatus]
MRFRLAIAAVTSLLPAFVIGDLQCANGALDEDYIQLVLTPINAAREKLQNGKEKNGPDGDYLPEARYMETLKWSCDLEERAISVLGVKYCPDNPEQIDKVDSAKRSHGKAEILHFNWDLDYGTGSRMAEMLESFYLPALSKEEYQLDVSSDGIRFSGGDERLAGYADLMRANTTEIGCAKEECGKFIKTYCITNQPPIKNGEIIYEPLWTTTTNSATTATTNSAITTTTSFTITTTTTMTTTTTKKPKLSTTPCPTAPTMRKVPRTTTPCPTLPTSATAKRKAREVNLIKEKALFPEAELEDKEMCPDSFMTNRLRIRFLEMHNYRRALVALGKIRFKGKSLPQAQNMQKLRYDCKLEEVAAHYASQCPERSFRESSTKEIGENFLRIGDNVGGFEEAVNATVSIWWAGARRFGAIDPSMLLKSRNFGPRILSLTQMAWATTRYIGCSIVKCSSSYVSVCRYQPRGNVIKELVYKPGNTCTDCATGSKCIEELGLCD